LSLDNNDKPKGEKPAFGECGAIDPEKCGARLLDPQTMDGCIRNCTDSRLRRSDVVSREERERLIAERYRARWHGAKSGVDMSVNFAGVQFKNPVVTVSGTFGFGREYGQYYDLSFLGGVCVKGLTLEPRLGNKPPRIAETSMGAGMLNSVGLQNPGADAFIRDELPFLRGFDTVVIANISGNTVEEYALMAEKLSEAKVDILEVNVSCPNVKAGGMQFGTSTEGVTAVTEAVKKCATVPVMVKLSPNVTDIAEIARAAESAGADAISLINTLLGMRIDTTTRRPVLHNNVGGLSGPAIFPVAVRMVWQVSTAVKIPVMGMGGVMDGDNAVEMMLGGASLIGVGTACFEDPYAPIRIIQKIEGYLVDGGLGAARELTGKVVLN